MKQAYNVLLLPVKGAVCEELAFVIIQDAENPDLVPGYTLCPNDHQMKQIVSSCDSKKSYQTVNEEKLEDVEQHPPQ